MRDRLQEIQDANDIFIPLNNKKEEKKKSTENSLQDDGKLADFFQSVTKIREMISALKSELNLIENKQNACLTSVSRKRKDEIMGELDELTHNANQRARDVKNLLQSMDQSNKRFLLENKDSSDAKIRCTQYSSLTSKFVEVMNQYKDLQVQFKLKNEKQLERQIKIVKPNSTAEEIKEVMQSENFDLFAQQMVGRQTAEAKRAYENISHQHLEILGIEKGLLELQQLFLDMAVLIDGQGEMLDSIESHVQKSVVDTEKGVAELKQAIRTQRKTRKRMCCLFFFVVIVIALILVFVFALNGK